MADTVSELGDKTTPASKRSQSQLHLESRMPCKSGSRSISVVTNTSFRWKTCYGICSRQDRCASQASLLLLCFLKVFANHSSAQSNDSPFPPHRIAGNV